MTSTETDLSSDDRQLFRETVGTVRPLPVDSVSHPSVNPRPQPRRRAEAEIEADSKPRAPLQAGDVMSYSAPGMQRNSLRRLRQGRYDVDAELDLHGLSIDAARSALREFLADSLKGGRRCVRVIHGKGYRSGDLGPLLKNQVDVWLRQEPQVLAFCSARPKDGGTGAVYVLLRPPNDAGTPAR